MKTLILKSGEVCLLDDDAPDEVINFCWRLSHWGYAVRSGWDKYGKFTTLRMHRLVMDASKGQEIDHINRNKLDNRRCNLRVVSHDKNVWNRPAHKNNLTGIKGVGWHKRLKRFQARIRQNGKLIHIGYFDTADEARSEYNKVAVEMRGEFAVLS